MLNMQTDKALETMMAVLPDVAAIMNDPDADGIIARVKAGDSELEAGDAMSALIPLFARKYKQNLYNLVAAFQGITAEEVGKQEITRTIAVLAAGLKVYSGFFACCLHAVRNM